MKANFSLVMGLPIDQIFMGMHGGSMIFLIKTTKKVET
jgi:hypothetical protein